MDERVSEALRDTIKLASDCGDLHSVATLSMVRAAMLMNGENEVYEAVKPIAARLLAVEQSWPVDLEVG